MKIFKTRFKFLAIFLCSLILISNSSIQIFAADSSLSTYVPIAQSEIIEYTPNEVSAPIDDKELKQSKDVGPSATSIWNGITIVSSPDTYGINVRVVNVGVDALDSVIITVTGTGALPISYDYGSVPAIIGESHYFSIPMISCYMSYKISASIVDAGVPRLLYGDTATLKFTETKLLAWNQGTFSSRVASVDYHFAKHKVEVGATVIPQYLDMADNYKAYVLNPANTANLTIVKSTSIQYLSSTKYTHKTTGRFIILSSTTNEILSFGGTK